MRRIARSMPSLRLSADLPLKRGRELRESKLSPGEERCGIHAASYLVKLVGGLKRDVGAADRQSVHHSTEIAR